MELNLTAGQLEKAAEAAKRAWHKTPCDVNGHDVRLDWIEAVRAAAPHLQAQPQQVSGSLLQRRCQQAREALGHGAGLVDEIQLVSIVGEVLRRDADELLAEPIDSELHLMQVRTASPNYEGALVAFLKDRRARLFAPPMDPAVEAVGAKLADLGIGYKVDDISDDTLREIVAAVRRADATLKEKEQR